MNYHIRTRIRNERIASFESFEDRDACFETLDKIYGAGIDIEDSIDGAGPQILLQVLRNQHFVMGQLDGIYDAVRAKVGETGPSMSHDATMYDALRKKTRDLLEKEGYEP